jgi:hypothetical protein
MTHAQILSHVYGGTFTPSLGRAFDLSNGNIVAERIEDRLNPSFGEGGGEGTPINMAGDGFAEGTGGPDATDQLWNANFTGATAEAKFALYPQDFGFFDGAAGGSYRKLFDLQGSGFNVTGTANLSPAAGHLIRWGRSGEARTFSSREADNSDAYDHLITYEIHDLSLQGVPGGGGTTRWLIFWEGRVPERAVGPGLQRPGCRDQGDGRPRTGSWRARAARPVGTLARRGRD